MMCHRADLVPVYSFGENELFKQVVFSEGSFGRRLQDLFKKIMGFAPCLFVGDRLPVMPYRIPITTVGEFVIVPQPVALHKTQPFPFLFLFFFNVVFLFSVGSPIAVQQRVNPTEEEVDHYHRLYMDGLSKLFHEHKVSCGLPENHKLRIM